MQLNAPTQMFPTSWSEFARLHPFAPNSQTAGYLEMCDQLERWLAEITGFAAVSLQPNAGSQGEFVGLLAIREYHASRGEAHRNRSEERRVGKEWRAKWVAESRKKKEKGIKKR